MAFTPICVPCQRMMRCRKNEFLFAEDKYDGDIYSSDMFECEVCKTQILIGFGREPVAQHWRDKEQYDRYRAKARLVLNQDPVDAT